MYFQSLMKMIWLFPDLMDIGQINCVVPGMVGEDGSIEILGGQRSVMAIQNLMVAYDAIPEKLRYDSKNEMEILLKELDNYNICVGNWEDKFQKFMLIEYASLTWTICQYLKRRVTLGKHLCQNRE